MQGSCKVVRVKSDIEGLNGFLEINEEDFQEGVHELFTDEYIAETPQNKIVDPIVKQAPQAPPAEGTAQVQPVVAETGGWGDLGNKPVVPEA